MGIRIIPGIDGYSGAPGFGGGAVRSVISRNTSIHRHFAQTPSPSLAGHGGPTVDAGNPWMQGSNPETALVTVKWQR